MGGRVSDLIKKGDVDMEHSKAKELLSERKRQNLLKQLEEVDNMLSTAGIEWFPKNGDLAQLERKKSRIEDTLQYDDMIRTELAEEEMELG